MGGHLLGFVGSDQDGNMAGRYGLEGYFNEMLSGINGYLYSERDIAGRLIAVGERNVEPAVDGADIVLTIDRTIQYMACSKLAQTVQLHDADGGSVIILEPETGAVLAMCGYPDYVPEEYNQVENIDVYNNPAIFGAYEPGSVFKPFTMAAALDTEAVTPGTTYEDTGVVEIAGYQIRNSDEKAHGEQTMTQVLEESLNTGVIFAMEETGADVFTEYIYDFGFGSLTGIELDTEVAGNISSLDLPSDIYPATASFGQGVTATPLQVATAFAAVANGGKLPQPHVVQEVRYADGTVHKTSTEASTQVIKEKTSQFLSAMLVSVVEHGHGQRAGVDGYYVAGKTGTAQVASTTGPGYDPDVTIGSFAGFAPSNDPAFAMIVRIDRPRSVQWAESTAAPLFGELAAFLLQYLEVPPERTID
jgi:cell division protein FtsI/penicillin-binding protein 2